MSLVFRKQAQEILDANGLHNLKTGIDNNYYYATIENECGKRFVTIHGIRFSRKSPPKAEVDYACELLDAFVAKHKETFMVALRLQAEKQKLGEEPHSNIFKSGYYVDYPVLNTQTDYIRIYKNGTVQFEGQCPVDDFNHLKLSKVIQDKAKDVYAWKEKVAKLDKLLKEAWAETEKCDI